MIRSYLERGLIAGGIGGLAFGLFVAVVGNPLIASVETLGHAAGDSAGHGEAGGHGGHVVSAAITDLVSIGGGVLWGLLLGGVVFGALYYFLEPAIPGEGATKRYVLAAAGFVTVSGAPWLVLPPQPAGVEAAATTETRILWYGGMVVAGALVCGLAGYTYNRLTASGTGPALAALASLSPFAALAVPVVLAPTMATGGDVPAAMAAAYRGFVVFGQVWLWVVLASAHAWLGDRAMSAAPRGDTDRSTEGTGRPAD